MTEPRERPDTTWTPRGDRMLALLPADHPPNFDALPFEEQQWRGRVFLMIWTHTGSIPYSWATALSRGPEDEMARQMAMAVDEEEIAQRVAWAAQGLYVQPEGTAISEPPGNPPPA